MRSALLLCYDFPPCAAPGAAIRADKLVQYLPDFGWEVQVICHQESGRDSGPRPSPDASVIRVPSSVSPGFSYQLSAWSFARAILPQARAAIRARRPDVLFATCPPFPHALTAIRLGREFGIPVLVDFRDAWALETLLAGSWARRTAKAFLSKRVYPQLERRLFEEAAAIVTNTPEMQAAYEELYPLQSNKIQWIPNGFDESDFADAIEPPRRTRPQLLYCGRFQGIAGRSPEVLLRGLRLAIDAGCELDLRVLGDDGPILRDCVRRLNLEDYVHAEPSVEHWRAIRAIQEANLLVVYQGPTPSRVKPIAGKTFEYLRSGRPILAIVEEGDNANLMRRHAKTGRAVAPEDPRQVADALQELLPHAGEPSRLPDAEFLACYERSRIAGQFAARLDSILGSSGSAGIASAAEQPRGSVAGHSDATQPTVCRESECR